MNVGTGPIPDSGDSIDEDITIPVPWGCIKAKTWNSPKGLPVLLLHGRQDNAASFDELVPLLPDSFYYVAPDLPGHGRSSHFTKGLPIRVFDYVPVINHVVDHLSWGQFAIIGHSMGGHFAHYYCALFPDRVSKLVAIEAGAYIFNPKACAEVISSTYTNLKPIEQRVESGKSPVYPYETAVQRLKQAREVIPNDGITDKVAENLAKRCLVKTGSGYRFSMDLRLRAIEETRVSSEQSMELLQRIKCPVLHILATESLRSRQEYCTLFEPVRQLISRCVGESYRYHIVEGGHNLHMVNSEIISGIVSSFLGNTKSAL